MQNLLLIFVVMGMAGCGISHELSVREISLSRSNPRDNQLKIELVNVEPSGAATIYSQDIDGTITADAGQPFHSPEVQTDRSGTTCTPFGRSRLVLVSSDPNEQTVELLRYTCKTYKTLGPFKFPD